MTLPELFQQASKNNGLKNEEKLRNSSQRKLELDGKTWIQNSVSIWSDIRKSAEEIALGHPAIFPGMLASKLISCFSWTGDIILDPFAGTGSTLLAAKKLGRESIGIELSKKFIKVYKNRTSNVDIFEDKNVLEPKMINDNCNNLQNYVKEKSIQLTITSPPYWDILNQKRSADSKKIRNYGNSEEDLGNIVSYEEFIHSLKLIFTKVYDVTKDDGFCCVNVMDLRKKNKFYPYHIDVTLFMKEIGFELDDIIIWDRKQEYNNLRPLGHPYVFRVNKVHEFILIFKKWKSN